MALKEIENSRRATVNFSIFALKVSSSRWQLWFDCHRSAQQGNPCAFA